ncbi:MAG: hypothetical protein IAG10_29075 [Planctomycetaceae bacterium]|nr:hypothetical protein [Planctomycetaceae bacterium]
MSVPSAGTSIPALIYEWKASGLARFEAIPAVTSDRMQASRCYAEHWLTFHAVGGVFKHSTNPCDVRDRTH